MSDFVWLRHEFPWLESGFVHAVHEDSVGYLRERLLALDFDIREMSGTTMVRTTDVLGELGLALRFEEYIPNWGKNWDAFEDCWNGIADDLPARIALLWRDADRAAKSTLKGFSEAIATLVEKSRDLADGRAQAA